MSLFVLGSVRASPGVTTTALALSACLRRGLFVEADCDGGVLALRYRLGPEPGLTTLAAAGRDLGGEEVLAHSQDLPGGMPVLVGPDAPDQAVSLWRTAGDRLVAALSRLDRDVVVDAGRISPTSPTLGLVAAASKVLVVARPRPEELVPVARRLPAVRRLNPAVALVLVGERPYSASAIATDLGCQVAGVVADDPRAARALGEGGSVGALARTALARTAATLAGGVVGDGRPAGPEATGRETETAPHQAEVGR